MFRIYIKLLFLIGISAFYMGCQEEPYNWIEDEKIAKVTDIEVTNITGAGATVLFTVKSSKDMLLTDLRIDCVQKDKSYLIGTFEPTFLGDGHYQVNIGGLISAYNYDISIFASVDEEIIKLGSANFTTADISYKMPYIAKSDISTDKNNIHLKGTIKHRDNELSLTEVGVMYYTGVGNICNTVKGSLNGDDFYVDIKKLDWYTSYTFYIYFISGEEKIVSGTIDGRIGLPFYINVSEKSVVDKYTASFDILLECYDSDASNVSLRAYAVSGVSTGHLSDPYWAECTLNSDNSGKVFFYGLSSKTTYVWYFSTISWIDGAKNKHTANIGRDDTNKGQSGYGNYFFFTTG